jgi:hypothetical protein
MQRWGGNTAWVYPLLTMEIYTESKHKPYYTALEFMILGEEALQ